MQVLGVVRRRLRAQMSRTNTGLRPRPFMFFSDEVATGAVLDQQGGV